MATRGSDERACSVGRLHPTEGPPLRCKGRIPRSFGTGRITRTKAKLANRSMSRGLPSTGTNHRLPAMKSTSLWTFTPSRCANFTKAFWIRPGSSSGSRCRPTSKKRSFGPPRPTIRSAGAKAANCSMWARSSPSSDSASMVSVHRERLRKAWRLPATNSSVVVVSCGCPLRVQACGLTLTVRLPMDSSPVLRSSPVGKYERAMKLGFIISRATAKSPGQASADSSSSTLLALRN